MGNAYETQLSRQFEPQIEPLIRYSEPGLLVNSSVTATVVEYAATIVTVS